MKSTKVTVLSIHTWNIQADVTWSTGETTDSINVSPTSTTLYVVTVELDSLTYVDTVNVVVLETDTFFDNHSACYEYEWNGEIYTESGIYNYETTSVNGCDQCRNIRSYNQ